MKFVLLSLSLALPLTAAAVPAAFEGEDRTYAFGSCETAPMPSYEKAEQKAAKRAAEYCAKFDMKSQRVSEFTRLPITCRGDLDFASLGKVARVSAGFDCINAAPHHHLAGNYRLGQECRIENNFIGTVVIPSGRLTLQEGVKVANGPGMSPSESLAIVLTLEGAVDPSLILREGRREQASMGEHPVAIGEYNPLGAGFLQRYGTSTGNGFHASSSIRLERVEGGLLLQARESFGPRQTDCLLTEL